MGEALFELENILRKDKISSQEANVLMQCKSNALRAFTLGATGAAAVSWTASSRLRSIQRLVLTTGGSLFLGLRTFRRSLDSSLNYILSLEGSRMQKELGTLLLVKYQDNPRIMQRVSRHFYSEEVYDDSSDRPRLRWRFRNFFGDNAAYPMVTDDHASNSEESDKKRTIPKGRESEAKQAQTNTVADAVENPFDCIFGVPAEVNEIQQTSRSNATSSSRAASKRHAHRHKRLNRRHRKHYQEASED